MPYNKQGSGDKRRPGGRNSFSDGPRGDRRDRPDDKGARHPRGDEPAFGRGRAPYGRDARRGEEAKGGPRPSNPPRGYVPPSARVDAPPAGADHAPVRKPFSGQAPVRTYAPAPAPELPENLLVGRNPIREALRSGQGIEKMLVTNGELTGSAREIVAMARDQHVVVQFVDRVRLDQIYPNHQGMLAYASAAEYASIDDILALAASRDQDALVVVLDGITDPHNLGAIIRSAECMGAHGVIIPERRSAGLNPAAVKAAAGALSHIKVARVVNLSRTLGDLKSKGLWITGAVMDGTPVDQAGMTGPMALVIGSEGDGISPLVRRQCDHLVSLKMYGQIESLNASVAAGILLYEAARARHDA